MIYRYDEATEFEIEERCFIVEMVSSVADPSCSVARARVKPGVTTALHSVKNTIERYIIVSGRGEVTVGKQPAKTVGPMDVVWIGSNEPQKIRNTSEREDLVFLCICTPGFQQENFVNLET